MKRAVLLAFWGAILAAQSAPTDDPVLRAMHDELERSRQLRIPGLDVPPYYIAYELEEGDNFNTAATLGGEVTTTRRRYRVPRVSVRVGNYDFDNTNYIFSGFYSGSRYDSSQLPLEAGYDLIRQNLWLATDWAYKGAVESLARKRAALKNITLSEQINDFAKAPPLVLMEPAARLSIDERQWTDRTRRLSALFASYPQVLVSGVDFSSASSTTYFANTEGSRIRFPDTMVYLLVRAGGQAPDGMTVRDGAIVTAPNPGTVPPETELQRQTEQVAKNVTALVGAPLGENYSGPVLFEAPAAAQLFAHLLGSNLGMVRIPVSEPGRPLNVQASELEGRIGSRILPEWMDVVDDPTQSEWRGQPLMGHYNVDSEAVAAKPLPIVEKGVLKNILLTRQPVRGLEGSNGRARLPGNFGANRVFISNLFVRASQPVPPEDLKRKLVEMCKNRAKPYGLLIRKIDFPSTASVDELRRQLSGSSSSGSTTRPMPAPLLVYKVYPDGREELVRGLRFRNVSVRSFKDLAAASDESYVLNFIGTTAPFSLLDAGGSIVGASAIAPSLLFEDLELERPQEELPKPPLVSPPDLISGNRAN